MFIHLEKCSSNVVVQQCIEAQTKTELSTVSREACSCRPALGRKATINWQSTCDTPHL